MLITFLLFSFVVPVENIVYLVLHLNDPIFKNQHPEILYLEAFTFSLAFLVIILFIVIYKIGKKNPCVFKICGFFTFVLLCSVIILAIIEVVVIDPSECIEMYRDDFNCSNNTESNCTENWAGEFESKYIPNCIQFRNNISASLVFSIGGLIVGLEMILFVFKGVTQLFLWSDGNPSSSDYDSPPPSVEEKQKSFSDPPLTKLQPQIEDDLVTSLIPSDNTNNLDPPTAPRIPADHMEPPAPLQKHPKTVEEEFSNGHIRIESSESV
jgi:hypothetical protein